MNQQQFINAVNQKYIAEGLPQLDLRDLPELTGLGRIGGEFTERDIAHPAIRELLQKKQAKIHSLQPARRCWLCQQPFIPARNLELYLYCELRAPPPENYCPDCLNKILRQLESRSEDLRCC